MRMKRKVTLTTCLRNDHRIKTSQTISLILVPFFSEDNVLSDEIKIWYIFEYQSNENRAFRFLGDTRYVMTLHHVMPLITLPSHSWPGERGAVLHWATAHEVIDQQSAQPGARPPPRPVPQVTSPPHPPQQTPGRWRPGHGGRRGWESCH